MSQIAEIMNYIDMLDKMECEIGIFSGEMDYIPEIEKMQNVKYPDIYIKLLEETKGGFFPNDYFDIELDGKESLIDHNIKHPKSHLKGFIVFALTSKSELVFIDIQNKLNRGIDAIFRIKMGAKKINEACYLAKDFIELFEILGTNKKPNDVQLKDES